MEQQQIETQAVTVSTEAAALVIRDQATLDQAGQFIAERITPLLQEANAVFDDIIKAAHQAHVKAIAAKKKVTEPLLAAQDTIQRSVRAFLTERERQEAERQRQAQAQAQAERDAEIARLRAAEEAEAQAALEERERQIEQAEASGASSEQIAALTQAPVTVPNAGLADAISREPIPVPVAPSQSIKLPSNIGQREIPYVPEIFDIHKLCQSIGAGLTPAEYVNIEPSTAMKAACRQARNIWKAPPGVRGIPSPSSTGITTKGSRTR